MFGPNARTTFDDSRAFHHRGPDYHALLRMVVALMRERFALSSECDVCVLSGSGTLANEAVLASLPGDMHYHPAGGEFTSRLRKLRAVHEPTLWLASQSKFSGSMRAGEHWAMVAYETAESRAVSPVWPNRAEPIVNGVRFADCVSSFPYYPLPVGADVWTTVSSKQLGAVPIISMVVVDRRCWGWFREAETAYSYLNLRRYQEAFRAKSESPHTPSIAVLVDLARRLEAFDVRKLRDTIDTRRQMFVEAFSPEDILGEGPVVTIRRAAMPTALAASWDLYRSAAGFQFFLYSGTDAEYEQFLTHYRRQHG